MKQIFRHDMVKAAIGIIVALALISVIDRIAVAYQYQQLSIMQEEMRQKQTFGGVPNQTLKHGASDSSTDSIYLCP